MARVPGMRRRRIARPTGRPVEILDIQESDTYVLVHKDGTITAAPEISLSPWSIGRIRAGYMCANCFEDLDQAYPDECPMCKFPMRERQAELVAKSYQGEKKLGPATSLEEEQALMQELRERKAREQKQLWTPSVSVPRSP